MREFVIPLRAVFRSASRPLRAAPALLVAAALSLPGRVGATPADDDLEARAVLLDEEGRDAEAAAIWQQLADETDDGDIRLIAYARALHAWERAFDASGEASHLCAARSILARTLADERIADEGRRELAAHRPALDEHAIDCTPWRPPAAAVAVQTEPPAISPAEVIDAPKVRSPRIIVGAGMAGLAAASLGGFVYAAAADRAIVRGYRELTAEYDATGTYDEAVADRLDAEAPVVRGLAIGLGVTTAALTAASLGLLLSGRRRQATAAASSLSIHPQVRRDLGGVAITGRF